MDIINEEIERVPCVTGNPSFKSITETICKPSETKAPSWWFIAFFSSISIMMLLIGMIGYLVWEGVGVWGLNNPVGWGFAIVNFVFSVATFCTLVNYPCPATMYRSNIMTSSIKPHTPNHTNASLQTKPHNDTPQTTLQVNFFVL